MKKLISFFFGVLVWCSLCVEVQNKNINYTITHEQIQRQVSINEYERFREKLAFKESRNRYDIVSRSGTYIGKYQFGPQALQDIGIMCSKTDFIKSKNLQEKALLKYLQKNSIYLQDEIHKFAGQTIRGVQITKSGLLAAAHLVGHNAVKDFLYTSGDVVPVDGNNTSVTEYLRTFANYNFDLDIIQNEIEVDIT